MKKQKQNKSLYQQIQETRVKGRTVFGDASVEGRTYLQLETMEKGLTEYRDILIMTRGGFGIALFLIGFVSFALSLAFKGFSTFTWVALGVSIIIAVLTVIDVLRVVLIANRILDRVAIERDARVKEILNGPDAVSETVQEE